MDETCLEVELLYGYPLIAKNAPEWNRKCRILSRYWSGGIRVHPASSHRWASVGDAGPAVAGRWARHHYRSDSHNNSRNLSKVPPVWMWQYVLIGEIQPHVLWSTLCQQIKLAPFLQRHRCIVFSAIGRDGRDEGNLDILSKRGCNILDSLYQGIFFLARSLHT